MHARNRTAIRLAFAIVAIAATATSGGLLRASGDQASFLHSEKVPTELADAAETASLTYWIVLRERADLTPASRMARETRGRFVVAQLRSTAERSQKGLREFLRARGARLEPFWAANVVKVTSDKATLTMVAHRREVERIEMDRVLLLPEPLPGVQEATIQAIEWNVAKVRAPDVWTAFGTRGEDIVVGSIDTGVQFTHPALVNQYRGNLGGGLFDHNYSWYDPSLVCGNPSTAPCDNNNHGTHTMGTIAGDDRGVNQIGVAPGLRWITAKGCEGSSCSLTALAAAGQWMLAPTDLRGENPRPDLRPHIVSNSWGSAGGNTFYQQIVQSWVAAGIFPVFANGNSGPGCGTAGSPGDYPEAYAVGAYDASNAIASFSSRGASALGAAIKPNISAPGVNVRSAIAGNGYAAFSGTSMATPHIAGIVALMWSAAPALVSDVASTRMILDGTAVDAPDTSCGGAPGNNNVYGEGRVDAFAAVELSPRGSTGTLQGTVTDAVTGGPLAGMAIESSGPSRRTTTTNAAGGYSFAVPAGNYDVTVGGFGYLPQTVYGVAVREAAATTRDIALAPATSVPLSGTVRDSTGRAVPDVMVRILGTPLVPAITDADGIYRFVSVPAGTYDIRAEASRCTEPETRTVALTGSQSVDFVLRVRSDSFGYACRIVPQTWIDAVDVLPLTGNEAIVEVTLPFRFSFYGGRYSTAIVDANGLLTFGSPGITSVNASIPNVLAPNAAVYVLWDDLYLDASSVVRTATVGVSPNRWFVVEWRDVAFNGELSSRVDFELALGEGGEVLAQYRNISNSPRERGYLATIGLENASGTVGYQYSAHEGVISDGLSVRYEVTVFTGVQGVVWDANDSQPMLRTTVRALQNDVELQRVAADATGYYRLRLEPGSYAIEASSPGYETASLPTAVTSETAATVDLALRTPRVEAAPASLSFAVVPGQSAQQTLAISNTGSLAAHWQLAEMGGNATWLSEFPVTGVIAPGSRELVQVSVNTAGLARGGYAVTLGIQSDSARRPSLTLPLNLNVSQYEQMVNAGGPRLTSGNGLSWAPDTAYAAGGWGYTNANSTIDRTRRTIAGTTDVAVYQTQRISPGEYRFDRLTPGIYEVTVGFAEIRQLKPGARVVDIVAEGTPVISAHDVASHVGSFVADAHTFTIAVTDGQLNLRFTPRPGSQPALVNAITVTQRQ